MLEHIPYPLDKIPVGFNWISVLKDLASGAPLGPQDHFKLLQLAGNWPTCACGQICKHIPKDGWGKPSDRRLSDLGLSFYNHIDGKEWSQALSTFYKIEARTTELLEKGKHENGTTRKN